MIDGKVEQPIYTDEEIKEIKVTKLIGPDTALFLWQVARKKDDNYKEADRIRNEAKKLGFNLSFTGKEYIAYDIIPPSIVYFDNLYKKQNPDYVSRLREHPESYWRNIRK